MVRVGVLRGGANKEYKDSLANGACVLRNLPRDMYEPVDLFVDADGVWHHAGLPLNYEKLKQKVDVIWNALYGYYGADGQVQQLLEGLGIPYIGSSPFVSALSMNKKMTKDHVVKAGVSTAQGLYIENWGDEDREETVSLVTQSVAEKLSPPWIIEPISLAYSSGPIKAKDRIELYDVLLNAYDLSMPVLIEEEIFGKEVSVVSLPGFRNQPSYTFLPIHNDNGVHKSIFRDGEKIQKLVADLHRELNLGQFSVVTCIVDKKGDISVHKVETSPALHPGSSLHHALQELGVTFPEFARHLISSTLSKN